MVLSACDAYRVRRIKFARSISRTRLDTSPEHSECLCPDASVCDRSHVYCCTGTRKTKSDRAVPRLNLVHANQKPENGFRPLTVRCETAQRGTAKVWNTVSGRGLWPSFRVLRRPLPLSWNSCAGTSKLFFVRNLGHVRRRRRSVESFGTHIAIVPTHNVETYRDKFIQTIFFNLLSHRLDWNSNAHL